MYLIKVGGADPFKMVAQERSTMAKKKRSAAQKWRTKVYGSKKNLDYGTPNPDDAELKLHYDSVTSADNS